MFKSAKLTAEESVENICCEKGEYGCLVWICRVMPMHSLKIRDA
jgi:hypothetical protein